MNSPTRQISPTDTMTSNNNNHHIHNQTEIEVKNLIKNLKDLYRTHNLEWIEHCEAIDRLRSRLNQKKRPPINTPLTASVEGSIPNTTFPAPATSITIPAPITSGSNNVEGYFNNPTGSIATTSSASITAPSRTTRRTANFTTFGVGDAVTDAQFDIVLAHLGTADQKDPNIRAMKTTALIPDMALTQQQRSLFIHSDHDVTLIKDPIAFYQLQPLTADSANPSEEILKSAESGWSKEEQKLFETSYGLQPKQFGWIASQIQTKTRAECVLYYYRTKRFNRYRNLHAHTTMGNEGKPREMKGKRARKPGPRASNLSLNVNSIQLGKSKGHETPATVVVQTETEADEDASRPACTDASAYGHEDLSSIPVPTHNIIKHEIGIRTRTSVEESATCDQPEHVSDSFLTTHRDQISRPPSRSETVCSMTNPFPSDHDQPILVSLPPPLPDDSCKHSLTPNPVLPSCCSDHEADGDVTEGVPPAELADCAIATSPSLASHYISPANQGIDQTVPKVSRKRKLEDSGESPFETEYESTRSDQISSNQFPSNHNLGTSNLISSVAGVNESDSKQHRAGTSSYWTKDERLLFQNLIKEFGSDFSEISRRIVTKTEMQCRNYHQSNEHKLSTATLQTVSAVDEGGPIDAALSTPQPLISSQSCMQIRNLLNDEPVEPTNLSDLDASTWFEAELPDNVPVPQSSSSAGVRETSSPRPSDHLKRVMASPTESYVTPGFRLERQQSRTWTPAPRSLPPSRPHHTHMSIDLHPESATNDERFADPPSPPSIPIISLQPASASPVINPCRSQHPSRSHPSHSFIPLQESYHRRGAEARATLPPHLTLPHNQQGLSSSTARGLTEYSSEFNSPISPHLTVHHHKPLSPSRTASPPARHPRHLSVGAGGISRAVLPPSSSRQTWAPSPLSQNNHPRHHPNQSGLTEVWRPYPSETWGDSTFTTATHRSNWVSDNQPPHIVEENTSLPPARPQSLPVSAPPLPPADHRYNHPSTRPPSYR